jgi:uncharacterized repeat protein (TIGR03803 family)
MGLGSFNTTVGKFPFGPVVVDSSGNVYGTVSDWAVTRGGPGALFEVLQGSGQVTDVATFGPGTGLHPFGGLIADSNGNLYGTAANGGAYGGGTVVELAKGSTTLTTLASFGNGSGINPRSALIMDASGNLYGTTSGTVFELAAGTATITTLALVGGTPAGALVMDASGNLYGVTEYGGSSGDGTVFELAKGSSAITTLASFNGTDGAYPESGLVMDGSGDLYGTAFQGGASNQGTVFELPYGSGTITTLASFDGTDGANPRGTLVMDSSGDLYGIAAVGGAFGFGSVFEVGQGSSAITTLASFGGRAGSNPSGLTVDGSGNPYGVTEDGSTNKVGAVFALPGGAIPNDQWTGANSAVDTNWSDGANWSLGAPPTAGQTALFTKNASVQSFTATVDAGFTNSIAGLEIDSTWGGTITVNSPLSVTGDFGLESGLFGGKGAVTIGGRLSQWTGGRLIVGAGGFTNTGTLYADTTARSLVLAGAGTLTNDGTIYEAGTNTIMLENGATLRNAAGATLDLTDNGGVSQSISGTFTNAGTLEKTGGTGTSTVSSSLVNSGQITVETGTLAVASAGGNRLQWTGGTIDVAGGTFTNAGTLNLDTTVGNLVLTGAGTFSNAGSITEAGTNSLVLENQATLDNAAGAVFDLTDNASVTDSGGGAFRNSGTLEKTGGTGTSTIATSILNNLGTVAVASGTLNISAPVTQVSGNTLNAGTWTVTGTATVHAKLNISSAGRFATLGSAASVTLDGTTVAFPNLAGLATIDQGASLSLLDGQSRTTSGALTNSGSLILGPGSTLTVSGSFTQTSTGTLTAEVGGTDTAPTVGEVVSTSSTVSLAGGLDVTSTVVPAVGSSLTLLVNEGNSPISGTFAGLPEGGTFTVTVGGTTMTFQISYVGPGTFGDNNVVITRTS